VNKLVGIIIALAIGLCVASPRGAAAAEDVEKMQLMLHGATAVYASTVMTMKAYPALLTKEEATIEIVRNTQFLDTLSKSASRIEQAASLDDDSDISFAKDYLIVCNYLKFALESLTSYIDDGNDLDRKLAERYIRSADKAMTRLLKSLAGR